MAETQSPSTSFSGVDMTVHFAFPGVTPFAVGTATTLTYSTFRETRQVRTLSRINIKGVTRGQRTIGGTIIFTVVNQHVVQDIMDFLRKDENYKDYSYLKIDELPPFDIIMTFGNEYGNKSSKVIYGVTIVDDGGTFSIEDMFTETTMTYIARDIANMKKGNLSDIYEGTSTEFRAAAESIKKAVATQVITAEELLGQKNGAMSIGGTLPQNKDKGGPTNSNPSSGPGRLGY